VVFTYSDIDDDSKRPCNTPLSHFSYKSCNTNITKSILSMKNVQTRVMSEEKMRVATAPSTPAAGEASGSPSPPSPLKFTGGACVSEVAALP
jgi:hypothetical protein